jgi:hypothetical protein
MPALTAALDTALAGDRPLVFGALEILLPGRPVRLLDGSGQLTLFGNTFVGEDTEFGVLAAVSSIADGLEDAAPSLNITLIPKSSAAAATLAAPGMQGSSVRLWAGAINQATGVAVSDPNLLFIGELDVATLRSGADGRTLEYEVTSVMERLFSTEEGQKLSDSFHQSIWPGETGLFDVTGVEFTVYWGVQPPQGVFAFTGVSDGEIVRAIFDRD